MFIRTEIVSCVSPNGRHSTCHVIILQCNFCDIEFERRYTKSFENRQEHYCCAQHVNDALRKGGLIDNDRKEKCLVKRGVLHHMQDPASHKNFTDAMQDKYGVDHPSQSCELRERLRQKCHDRHSVDHTFQVQETRAKIKSTNQAKYGSDSPLSSPVIREKIRKTCIDRYGVDNILKLPEMRTKAQETMLERWGVDHPSRSPEIRQRMFDTMNADGDHSSIPERRCYSMLCELYGSDGVKRQHIVRPDERQCWEIDFKCRQSDGSDLYIQLDGAYWHGLTSDTAQLHSPQTRRARAILQTFYRDKRQVEWFAKSGMRLVRITDNELKCIKTAHELMGVIATRV